MSVRQWDDGARGERWGVAQGPDRTTKAPSPDVRCPSCGHVGPVDPMHGAAHRALELGEGLVGSVWRTRSSGKTARVVGVETDGSPIFSSPNGVRWSQGTVMVTAYMELIEKGTDLGR